MGRENSPESDCVYTFGPFRLDAGERRLWREGEAVSLTRKDFDLLLILVADAGRLKTREELISSVWPHTIIEDQGLTQRMHTLRLGLGDEGDTPRYIETVRGVGYRFIAPVTVSNPPSRTAASTGDKARSGLWIKIGVPVLLAVLVAIGFFSWFYLARPSGDSATDVSKPSIAVLPFENLSSDDQNEYFVAGIQDLILTKLADIGGLRVIARTSTEKYNSHPLRIQAIARQLGVATILEGSVQKQGNRVLVNVQLINARTSEHIWAQTYTRTLDNVFGVEGEIAATIAQALKARLTASEEQQIATTLSNNPVANNLYLKAEYFTNLGTINYYSKSLKRAISLYQQAIAKAPDFAEARARLSYAESVLAFFGGAGESVKALQKDARKQAKLALALQADLPDAYLAIGYSDYYGKGDYAGALKAFDRALKLRPNDVAALAARGYVLRREGKFDAAIAALQKALTLDPLNTSLVFETGSTDMMASRYAEAEKLFRRALALDPDNIQAKRSYSQAILFDRGDLAEALTQVKGDHPLLQRQRVKLLILQRRYKKALTLLDAIPDTPANFGNLNGPKALQQANLHRLMGDAAQARPLYKQALAQTRAQLGNETGITLAFAWGNVASAELGLGHTDAALAAIAKSQAIVEQAHDHVYGPPRMEMNAGLYARAGRADLAVPLLSRALAAPGIGVEYSPVMLWIDPVWDSIRSDPRFQELLKKYAEYQPVTSLAASHS